MTMGFEEKALAFAILIFTINAVLLVGFAQVGIDFSNTNMFSWVDSAILEKGELAAEVILSDSTAIDANVSLSESSITAEGTSSDVINIPLLSTILPPLTSLFNIVNGMLFGYLYILEFLKIPVAIQFILGVPIWAIIVLGIYYILRGALGAIGGFFT